MKKVLATRLIINRLGTGDEKNDDDHNGTFLVSDPKNGRNLLVSVSDKNGWDHVIIQVSEDQRMEVTTSEVEFVRGLVFQSNEVVVEYLSRPHGYVNALRDGARHLWRNQEDALPEPPLELF